ncbi:MAG TPA: hypothetical protein VID51_05100 [Solirubrobacterales bacterium]
MTPPKEEPATRRPVIRKRGTMSRVSPCRPRRRRCTGHAGGFDRLAHHGFQELDGDRTRIVVTGTFDSKESRDAILEASMEKGVREGYEKLDELLTRRRTRR